MENEIQLDLFNCKERFCDENNSWTLNYQSLPIIMSGLKMDGITSSSPSSLSSSSSNSITFQSEAVFSIASTSDTHPQNRDFKDSVSSCSDDENESENYRKSEIEQSPFKTKFRELRSRACESIMKINHRTITKPKKLTKEIKLTPNAIKKLYIQSGKKLGRFKPSNLETIFEEPIHVTNSNEQGLLGKRKLKRSLSCSDGLNITKATIKNRRQKIKRLFGKRFALKKINLAEFKEKLNSSMEEWEDLNDNSEIFEK
ncbi:protein tantalus [Condylostylus longicornis]|uniref:protein tantalus n=1 Tax=Condylostylus longicornis TaxID=2530218 RepID=UPI00244DAB45|nr:protein tantalus [Condylostylus longicornis]